MQMKFLSNGQIVSGSKTLTKIVGLRFYEASETLKVGQTVEVKEGMRSNSFVADALESFVSFKDFVEVDKENRKGKYVRYPERKELNQEVNELLVIEYYNR